MNGVKTLLLDPSYPTKGICMPRWHIRPGEDSSLFCSYKSEFYFTVVIFPSPYSDSGLQSVAGHYVLWEYLTKGV